MKIFVAFFIFMMTAMDPVWAADPVDAVPKAPVCQDKMVPYLTLTYDGRTMAATDIAGAVLREKKSEIEALAAGAGITHIKIIGNNYTVYSKNNSTALMCAGTPIEFKPGESMVQVKANYELTPASKVSAFADALVAKGYIPTINEMKRTVCE